MSAARSLAVGENSFDLFMAQSSHRFELPQNLQRFVIWDTSVLDGLVDRFVLVQSNQLVMHNLDTFLFCATYECPA